MNKKSPDTTLIGGLGGIKMVFTHLSVSYVGLVVAVVAVALNDNRVKCSIDF